MAQSKTILVVDDDDDLRSALAEQIALEDEFQVIEAATGAAGVETAKASAPDLILLDVDLPDINGREACRRMRADGIKTPIIMLTGAISDSDTIQGLESGADDYVAKPFRFAVLLARIRVQLRSHEQSETRSSTSAPTSFGPRRNCCSTPPRRRCG